jgi:hypothetical protein
MSTLTHPPTTDQVTQIVYRFEGQLSDPFVVGHFPQGIEFHNEWVGRVTAGPFAGGTISGVDQFTVRPDGVGVIDSPEIIEWGDVRVAAHVRGYVVPPEGVTVPPLEAMLEPGFSFPDLDFRVTAATVLRTAHPDHQWLNRVVAVNDGTVNLATGRMEIQTTVAGTP